MKGTCQCGEAVEMRAIDGRWQFVNHACAKRPLTIPKGEAATSSGDVVPPPSGRLAKTFSNAKRTACGCGRTHPSKMQARVCARLREEIEFVGAANGRKWTLYHEVVMPLFRLAPRSNGKPFTICVDFVVVSPTGEEKYIDAKAPGRVSRDWPARAAAFAAQYGKAIEEVSS